jgi:hypothetical protein
MPVPAGIGAGRAGNVVVVEFPSDTGNATPGESLREDSSYGGCGHRIGFQTVPTPTHEACVGLRCWSESTSSITAPKPQEKDGQVMRRHGLIRVMSFGGKERPRQAAKRVMDARYGAGDYETGPGSEFSQIKKSASRN